MIGQRTRLVEPAAIGGGAPAALPRGGPAKAVLAGIVLSIGAHFVLSVMDVLVKLLSEDYPTTQIAAVRLLATLPVFAILVWRAGGTHVLVIRRPGKVLLQCLLLLGTITSFFYSFRELPLADAYAIAFSAPLIVTVLSIPLLGESVGPRRWAAVIVGFLGTLMVLRPGAEGVDSFISVGAMAALCGAGFYALTVINLRQLTKTEGTIALVVTPALINGMILMPLIGPAWVTPVGWDVVMMASTGLVGAIGMILLVEAYRHAPPMVLAPFDYLAMLWAFMFGYFVWGDLPTGALWWIGMATVIGSGLYIIYREAVNARAQKREASDE